MKFYLSLIFIASQFLQANTQTENNALIALRSIKSHLSKNKQWKARISQSTYSAALGDGPLELGHMTFSHPKKFKVDFDHQSFVTNGKEAWLVQYPEGKKNKPYIAHFSDIKNANFYHFLSFIGGSSLADQAAVKKKYKLSYKKENLSMIITLYPKDTGTDFRKVLLYFNSKTYQTQRVVFENNLGDLTKIRFIEQVPTKVPSKTFTVIAPKGVEIRKL